MILSPYLSVTDGEIGIPISEGIELVRAGVRLLSKRGKRVLLVGSEPTDYSKFLVQLNANLNQILGVKYKPLKNSLGEDREKTKSGIVYKLHLALYGLFSETFAVSLYVRAINIESILYQLSNDC